jgi:hypothetical protein
MYGWLISDLYKVYGRKVYGRFTKAERRAESEKIRPTILDIMVPLVWVGSGSVWAMPP